MSKNTKPAKAKEVPQQAVASIAPDSGAQVLIFDASTEGKDSKSFHYEMSVPMGLVADLRVLFKRVEEVGEGGALLPTTAEKEAPQQGGFLVGVFLEGA